MSALPGKVAITGIADVMGEKVFVLTMLQARNPQWTKTPFFAKYNETATWLNELEPAFGENRFFYQYELDQLVKAKEGQMFFNSAAGTKVMEDSAINIDE